jgi:hypothetical protein
MSLTDSDPREPSPPTLTLPLYPMSIHQNTVLGWLFTVLDTPAWRMAPEGWVVTVCVRFGSRRLRFYGKPTDPNAKVRSSVDAVAVEGGTGRYEIYGEPLNEEALRHLEKTSLHDDILERFYPQAPCWPTPVPRAVAEFAASLAEPEQVLAPYPSGLAYALAACTANAEVCPWTAATVLVELAAHVLGGAAPNVSANLQETARALRRDLVGHMDCASDPHAFDVHGGEGVPANCAARCAALTPCARSVAGQG